MQTIIFLQEARKLYDCTNCIQNEVIHYRTGLSVYTYATMKLINSKVKKLMSHWLINKLKKKRQVLKE